MKTCEEKAECEKAEKVGQEDICLVDVPEMLVNIFCIWSFVFCIFCLVFCICYLVGGQEDICLVDVPEILVSVGVFGILYFVFGHTYVGLVDVPACTHLVLTQRVDFSKTVYHVIQMLSCIFLC